MKVLGMNIVTMIRQSTAVLAVAVLLAPGGRAQEHILPISELQQALSRASSTRQMNQAIVDDFFEQKKVRDLLRDSGVDPVQLRSATTLLNDDDLAKLTGKVRSAQTDLSAGDLTSSQITLIILAVTLFAVLAVFILAFK